VGARRRGIRAPSAGAHPRPQGDQSDSHPCDRLHGSSSSPTRRPLARSFPGAAGWPRRRLATPRRARHVPRHEPDGRTRGWETEGSAGREEMPADVPNLALGSVVFSTRLTAAVVALLPPAPAWHAVQQRCSPPRASDGLLLRERRGRQRPMGCRSRCAILTGPLGRLGTRDPGRDAMDSSTLDRLTQRLERLERENRRWKLASCLSVLALVAMGLMGQAVPDKVAKVGEAERFVLRDSAGRLRAELRVGSADRSGLWLFSKDGLL